jgi:Arc/MetJ-type ribon-helix-helix transcriptional regulator
MGIGLHFLPKPKCEDIGDFFMLKEQTFKLDDSTIKFLDRCQEYGFQEPSEVVRTALQKLQLALESDNLQESANLYAEIYESDRELQELTEAGLEEWLKE